MLLKSYTKEMFRPKCNPSFQSVHCAAHLDQDISEVLPYLNTVLGGTNYAVSPPALTLQAYGKLITLHSREIYVNALQDEEEAEKILKWLQHEINETWEKRKDIQPMYQEKSKPQMLEILRLLPRTNCGECREPTCTVFALRVSAGVKGPEDCPGLPKEKASRLREYLKKFDLDP
jgi:ArsR family metal-binding transcriptional regulator